MGKYHELAKEIVNMSAAKKTFQGWYTVSHGFVLR